MSPSRSATRGRARPWLVSDVRAVRLLGSPLRQAILDYIAAHGESTVAELSDQLGRPADRLYYHVKLMCRAGLLLSRPNSTPALFDVPGRPMMLRYEPARPAKRRAVARVVSALLRTASRDFQRALSTGSVRVDGPRRELWAGRLEAALTPADIARVNTLLHEIMSVVGRPRARPEQPDGRTRVQFTWVLSPVARGGARRAPRASDGRG